MAKLTENKPNELPKETLGMFIRDQRVGLRMSLRELAERLQLAQSKNNDAKDDAKFSAGFLSDIENGRRFPSPRALHLLAEVLGVNVDELRALDQRMPTDELNRLHTLNPQFGFAFRRAVALIKEQSLSPQDVVERLCQPPPNNRE